MDNASAYGAEDSRFESWQGLFFSLFLALEKERKIRKGEISPKN